MRLSNGESVTVLPYQIVFWASIAPMGQSILDPRTPRFPIVLDSAFNHNFLIQERQLLRWAGLRPEHLRVLGHLHVYGQQVALHAANIWLHANQPGQRDTFADRPGFCLQLDLGIAITPQPATQPRLPLLGLHALFAAGLQLARRDEYGVDLSYLLTDRLTVYAAYTFEKFRYEMAGRQWTPGGISDPYVSETALSSNSNWTAEPLDRYHTVGLGGEVQLIPKTLRLNVSYSFSRSRGRIGLSSPLGTAANDVNPFVPTPFANVDNIDFHNLNADLECTLGKRSSLAAGYVFEKYRIDDYNYTGFTYTPANPLGLGALPTSGLLMGGMLPWPYHTNVAYLRLRVGM